jgi:membrane fusion protein (multidrug efflux system)
MKRWLTLIAVVVVLVLILGGIKGVNTYKMMQAFAAAPKPSFTVSATKAAYDDWQPQLSAVGSLRAIRGADLAPELAGVVDAIQFQSGDEVKAGQLLVQMRAADDMARLNALKATAELAEITYRRDQAQLEARAISQAQLDSDRANLKSARAQLAEQQALVDKKFIRAPFAGRLGIRAVDLGQYLAAGTKIVTLQTLDPIYVDFYLPQQSLGQLKVGQTVNATSDSFPGASFSGEVSAIDPLIDADTRNVQVRATLKNAERKLLPGMYANVSIAVGEPVKYLTLPSTAVANNPYGETVYIIVSAAQFQAEAETQGREAAAAKPGNPDKAGAAPPADAQELVAKQVFVSVGPKRGDQVAILKGIAEGDQVVTSGQLKLRNGAPVLINNSLAPSDDANARPFEH